MPVDDDVQAKLREVYREVGKLEQSYRVLADLFQAVQTENAELLAKNSDLQAQLEWQKQCEVALERGTENYFQDKQYPSEELLDDYDSDEVKTLKNLFREGWDIGQDKRLRTIRICLHEHRHAANLLGKAKNEILDIKTGCTHEEELQSILTLVKDAIYELESAETFKNTLTDDEKRLAGWQPLAPGPYWRFPEPLNEWNEEKK